MREATLKCLPRWRFISANRFHPAAASWAYNVRVEPTEPAVGSSEDDALLDRMRSLAAKLVSFAWDRFQLRLDYSGASITQVENILDKLQIDFPQKGSDSDAKIQRLSSYFGAYIGEVLRRKHGGIWRGDIPNVHPPTEGVEVGELIFAPSRNAYLRLTEGSAFNAQLLCQVFEEAIAQRRTFHELAEANKVSELVRNYSIQAVQDARKRFDFTLDYTEASLDFLDKILSRIADLLADRVPATEQLTEDGKKLLKLEGALNYGAYLGEVICKNLGAVWRDTIPGSETHRIIVAIDGKWLDPLEHVGVAIKNPQDSSVKKFYLDAKDTTQFNGVITYHKR